MALNNPLTIFLAEPLTKKQFENEHALGKTLRINNKHTLTVSAVINQQKANSSLSFSSIAIRKIVFSIGSEFTEWGWWNFNLFVLLKEGANPIETAQKIAALFPKEDLGNENYKTYRLNYLNDLYFSIFTVSWGDYLHGGDKRKVMILLMVAALVLIIALVNF